MRISQSLRQTTESVLALERIIVGINFRSQEQFSAPKCLYRRRQNPDYIHLRALELKTNGEKRGEKKEEAGL